MKFFVLILALFVSMVTLGNSLHTAFSGFSVSGSTAEAGESQESKEFGSEEETLSVFYGDSIRFYLCRSTSFEKFIYQEPFLTITILPPRQII